MEYRTQLGASRAVAQMPALWQSARMFRALLISPALRMIAAVASLCIALLIAYLSLIPSSGVPAPEVSDKIKHFIAYGALAAPLAVFVGHRSWPIAVAIATLFGIGMEFAQMMGDAGREGSIADALANFLGALLGAGIARIILGWAEKS